MTADEFVGADGHLYRRSPLTGRLVDLGPADSTGRQPTVTTDPIKADQLARLPRVKGMPEYLIVADHRDGTGVVLHTACGRKMQASFRSLKRRDVRCPCLDANRRLSDGPSREDWEARAAREDARQREATKASMAAPVRRMGGVPPWEVASIR